MPRRPLSAIVFCSLFAVLTFSPLAQGGEIVWSNSLAQAADLAGSSGAGALVTESGGGEVLHFSVTNATEPAVRAFPLPVERLRHRYLFLDAEVKGANISPKPNSWNGVKVMVRIDTPNGSEWPQAELPTGSFDWQHCSHRFLVPEAATAATLVLGLENVGGEAWFREVRLVLAKEVTDAPAAPADAPIFRGHDLPRLRGAMVAPDTLKESDLAVLAHDWGGNLIRWQLIRYGVPAHETGFENYDRWLEQQLKQLDQGLAWAASMGVKVVVDLHSPPGGQAIGGGYQAALGSIWTDPVAQAKFLAAWRIIATRYRGDNRIWGYDLMNEPVDDNVAEGCADWQALALRAGQAVRGMDPQRTLIIEPPSWGSAPGFIGFQPLALSNVVYSFHVYDPHSYTHQGVASPAAPLAYPGIIDGAAWDQSAIERAIQPATAFAARYRVHLYVGEFSVIRWAPGGEKYLSDLIEIIERHGWDWSYHAFREWDGWSVEHGPDKESHTPAVASTARKQVLLKWMGKNKGEAGSRNPYHFDHSISRPVLENYLSHAITMEGLFNGRGDLADNIRMLTGVGAKYIGRSLCLWGAERNFVADVQRAKAEVPRLLAADPDVVLEACVFETVSPRVDQVAIPAWVFRDLDQPVETRNFRYADMIYPEGQRRPMGPNAQVPDESRLETRRWFYYQAASYIDAGFEGIHFGQVEIMNRNDPDNVHWEDLLTRVRAYASQHARRHIVLCNGHVPSGGLMRQGRPLLDFHAFPLRVKEIPGKPQEAILELGFSDGIYNHSQGGHTVNGWDCEHLPYLVELDNYGVSHHPGQPNETGEFNWVWGYDEITWFAHQTKEYRARWLQYAWDWVRRTDPNGYLQMPGSRTASSPDLHWYYANQPSAAVPTGLGDEAAIRAVWAGAEKH